MFYLGNTKNNSSHRASVASQRISPTWRWSALALLSAACMTATAGVTTRVSVDSEGREGNDASFEVSISADGRYVAFASLASSLVPGDSNNQRDIFVHDRQAGTTTLVSVGSSGSQANGASWGAAISADGRLVGFISTASNLVPNDTNGDRDAFLHDVQTGQTTRVSVSSTGGQANNMSDSLVLSANGRFVAFASLASNLAHGGSSGFSTFVHDRETGQTTMASVSSAGEPGNRSSYSPAINEDGRFVAFSSDAENLVLGDTNRSTDVFVHDRQSGETTRVSVNSAGEQTETVYGSSSWASLSADARYVAFDSYSEILVTGDTNNVKDVFVHDRYTHETTRISVNSSGEQGNHDSQWAEISADGRYVVFWSQATNLVPGDTNGQPDVFMHDRHTGLTKRVSVSSTGAQGIFSSYTPALSDDGRYAAFSYGASNLVPGDTNGEWDVFVHDRLATLFEGPHGTATCTDGLDNDNDGNVDALDTDCALPPPPLMCNGKRVTIVGTPGNDVLKGTGRADVISALTGDDVVTGGGGNDVICGGPGNDKLYGGDGDDQLDGGVGVDACDGQTGTDTHLGGCETLLNTP